MTPEKARDWLSLLGVLGAVGFWFFTMYGLPPRVDALEERVRAHEEKLTRQDVTPSGAARRSSLSSTLT